MDIDKNALSKALTEKLGKEIQITGIEKIGGGYHSDGYKAISTDGKTYFVKKFKSHDLGFVFPERKVFSLLLSDGMAKRAQQKPLPVGILLANKDETKIIPDITDETEIYHIQEYEPEGTNHYTALQQRKEKRCIDEKDREEIRKIIDYIASIHAIKYPVADDGRKQEAYKDGIRSVLNSPELTLMILHDFDANNPVLDLSAQKEYLGLMYEVMHRWKNRSDRLCALHGDFWGANFFFRNDGSHWVIDYSRIPWGDPVIDVGWWLSQYLWFYFETGNEYFKELGELFLKEYEQKTNDHEIRKAVTIVLGLMGLINIFPRFYPNLDANLGKQYVAHIINILKAGEFKWE